MLVSHHRAHRFDGLVVMDRHLYCQLALRAAPGLPRGRLLPWLLRRLPQPDLVVFFDISPRRAYDRIKRRGIDQESLPFLEAFSAAYRALPEYPTFVTVAAGGTPTETTNQLVELTRQSLTSRSGDHVKQRRLIACRCPTAGSAGNAPTRAAVAACSASVNVSRPECAAGTRCMIATRTVPTANPITAEANPPCDSFGI